MMKSAVSPASVMRAPSWPEDRVAMDRRAAAIVLGLILVAALLLRLYKVTALALWFDEAASLITSSYPLSAIFEHIRADTGAPLYFLALKGWCAIFGRSVLALRLLSVTFGVAGVWLAFLFVREAFRDDRLALLSALMLAVNPFQLEYAHETRMYTMGVFLVTLASYLLARAIRLGRPADWLRYAVAAAACLYTHYYLLFSIAAQAAVAVGFSLAAPPSRRRRIFISVVAAYAVVAILFAPWLPVFLEQNRQVAHDFWVPALQLRTVLGIPWTVLFGSPDLWASSAQLLVVAAAAVALVALNARRAGGWPGWLVIAQALLPIAGGLALSVHRSIIVGRYFLFASASWSILAAGAVMMVPRPLLRRAVAASMVLVTVYAYERNLNEIGVVALRHQPLNPPGIAGAADYINAHAARGDAIIVTNSLIYFSFNYYNRAAKALLTAPTLDSIPVYGGRPMLTGDELIKDPSTLCCPRRVWYLWTDGFYDRRRPPPGDWQFVSRSRFADAPSFKGDIFVEEYVLPTRGARRAGAGTR